MNDDKAIVIGEEACVGTLAVAPVDVIARATAIAKPLGQMILDRKLFTPIKERKYVRVEGWTTLGAMLGILPREVSVVAVPDGYEAKVELIRADNGTVIGGASAICLRTEKRWADAPEYAVRSMAVTRATGKAFRLGFSWIIKLAGDYEPTPAEEMDAIEEEAPQTRGKSQPKWTLSKIEEIQPWLVEANVIPPNAAGKHTLALLELSPFGPAVAKADLITWAKFYRGCRDEGAAPKEAAAKATKMYAEAGQP